MSPVPVIRYGDDYSDDDVDELEATLRATGARVRLEPVGDRLGLGDIGAEVLVELAAMAAGGALGLVWQHLLEFAGKRRGEVVLQFPGGVSVVVPPPFDEDSAVWPALQGALDAGALTRGVWRWDPASEDFRRDPLGP